MVKSKKNAQFVIEEMEKKTAEIFGKDDGFNTFGNLWERVCLIINDVMNHV